MIVIGVDTGNNTGLAIWDTNTQKFVDIQTLKIHEALWVIDEINSKEKIKVFFEDARLRKWYGNNSNAKLQGAGSVKRDAKIWEDFLKDLNINFEAVAPQKGMTKLSDIAFRNLTKYDGRTNEHGRDAAMIVFGMKN